MNARSLLSLTLCTILFPCEVTAQDDSAWADRLDAEKAAYLSRHRASHAPEMLEEILMKIRTDSPPDVQEGVLALESMKEEELLMILLESGPGYQRNRAVGAIGRIGSKPYLSRILHALDEMSRVASSRMISNGEIVGMDIQNQQDLLTAIRRITGLEYDHPVEVRRREMGGRIVEFPQELNRESILAFIEEVRAQGRRPDKRVASAEPKPDLSRKSAATGAPLQGNREERSWLETIVGGALIGMVSAGFLILYNRLNRKDHK